jgi:hypothetical protein
MTHRCVALDPGATIPCAMVAGDPMGRGARTSITTPRAQGAEEKTRGAGRRAQATGRERKTRGAGRGAESFRL